ncbi:MAG: hypothetical protein U9Q19_07150 [Pseudomonadota bacterium]|nr:hypothetical protein [Pseudomonadota bacterium]
MRDKSLQRFALLCGCGAGFMASQLNAAPVISELFYDAAGSDAGFVFVELLDTPTPGVVPVVRAVPLPASLWLFISGLIPLFAFRSRWRGELKQVCC